MSKRFFIPRYDTSLIPKFAFRILLALVLSLVSSTPQAARAQGTTAQLGGTVTDSSGAVIPDANIQLKNTATGDVRNSKSNGAGVFSFSSVPTGNYQIEIQASGFRSFEQTGIHLDPGDQRPFAKLR
jgi:hypothetical protein